MSPDIDTSANRDPSPTGDELLAIRDRMLARLESGEPVRVITSVTLKPGVWDDHATFLAAKWEGLAPWAKSREASRCRSLADTGEHLGLDRVGLIVATDEVTS